MRQIIALLFVLFALCLSGQTRPFQDGGQNVWVTHHNIYVTPSIAPFGESYLRAEYEVTETFVILQFVYQTNFRQHFVQAKTGFGFTGERVRAYVYMPYFNYNITEEGYNTPFSAEVFLDKITPRLGLSCNLDIYKDRVVPSIRIRLKAFHATQTRYKPLRLWN